MEIAALGMTNETGTKLWDYQYAHLRYGNMKRLVAKNMVQGFTLQPSAFEEARKDICEPCVAAKHAGKPFKTNHNPSSV
jgi:hypothetical protein